MTRTSDSVAWGTDRSADFQRSFKSAVSQWHDLDDYWKNGTVRFEDIALGVETLYHYRQGGHSLEALTPYNRWLVLLGQAVMNGDIDPEKGSITIRFDKPRTLKVIDVHSLVTNEAEAVRGNTALISYQRSKTARAYLEHISNSPEYASLTKEQKQQLLRDRGYDSMLDFEPEKWWNMMPQTDQRLAMRMHLQGLFANSEQQLDDVWPWYQSILPFKIPGIGEAQERRGVPDFAAKPSGGGGMQFAKGFVDYSLGGFGLQIDSAIGKGLGKVGIEFQTYDDVGGASTRGERVAYNLGAGVGLLADLFISHAAMGGLGGAAARHQVMKLVKAAAAAEKAAGRTVDIAKLTQGVVKSLEPGMQIAYASRSAGYIERVAAHIGRGKWVDPKALGSMSKLDQSLTALAACNPGTVPYVISEAMAGMVRGLSYRYMPAGSKWMNGLARVLESRLVMVGAPSYALGHAQVATRDPNSTLEERVLGGAIAMGLGYGLDAGIAASIGAWGARGGKGFAMQYVKARPWQFTFLREAKFKGNANYYMASTAMRLLPYEKFAGEHGGGLRTASDVLAQIMDVIEEAKQLAPHRVAPESITGILRFMEGEAATGKTAYAISPSFEAKVNRLIQIIEKGMAGMAETERLAKIAGSYKKPSGFIGDDPHSEHAFDFMVKEGKRLYGDAFDVPGSSLQYDIKTGEVMGGTVPHDPVSGEIVATLGKKGEVVPDWMDFVLTADEQVSFKKLWTEVRDMFLSDNFQNIMGELGQSGTRLPYKNWEQLYAAIRKGEITPEEFGWTKKYYRNIEQAVNFGKLDPKDLHVEALQRTQPNPRMRPTGPEASSSPPAQEDTNAILRNTHAALEAEAKGLAPTEEPNILHSTSALYTEGTAYYKIDPETGAKIRVYRSGADAIAARDNALHNKPANEASLVARLTRALMAAAHAQGAEYVPAMGPRMTTDVGLGPLRTDDLKEVGEFLYLHPDLRADLRAGGCDLLTSYDVPGAYGFSETRIHLDDTGEMFIVGNAIALRGGDPPFTHTVGSFIETLAHELAHHNVYSSKSGVASEMSAEIIAMRKALWDAQDAANLDVHNPYDSWNTFEQVLWRDAQTASAYDTVPYDIEEVIADIVALEASHAGEASKAFITGIRGYNIEDIPKSLRVLAKKFIAKEAKAGNPIYSHLSEYVKRYGAETKLWDANKAAAEHFNMEGYAKKLAATLEEGRSKYLGIHSRPSSLTAGGNIGQEATTPLRSIAEAAPQRDAQGRIVKQYGLGETPYEQSLRWSEALAETGKHNVDPYHGEPLCATLDNLPILNATLKNRGTAVVNSEAGVIGRLLNGMRASKNRMDSIFGSELPWMLYHTNRHLQNAWEDIAMEKLRGAVKHMTPKQYEAFMGFVRVGKEPGGIVDGTELKRFFPAWKEWTEWMATFTEDAKEIMHYIPAIYRNVTQDVKVKVPEGWDTSLAVKMENPFVISRQKTPVVEELEDIDRVLVSWIRKVGKNMFMRPAAEEIARLGGTKTDPTTRHFLEWFISHEVLGNPGAAENMLEVSPFADVKWFKKFFGPTLEGVNEKVARGIKLTPNEMLLRRTSMSRIGLQRLAENITAARYFADLALNFGTLLLNSTQPILLASETGGLGNTIYRGYGGLFNAETRKLFNRYNHYMVTNPFSDLNREVLQIRKQQSLSAHMSDLFSSNTPAHVFVSDAYNKVEYFNRLVSFTASYVRNKDTLNMPNNKALGKAISDTLRGQFAYGRGGSPAFVRNPLGRMIGMYFFTPRLYEMVGKNISDVNRGDAAKLVGRLMGKKFKGSPYKADTGTAKLFTMATTAILLDSVLAPIVFHDGAYYDSAVRFLHGNAANTDKQVLFASGPSIGGYKELFPYKGFGLPAETKDFDLLTRPIPKTIAEFTGMLSGDSDSWARMWQRPMRGIEAIRSGDYFGGAELALGSSLGRYFPASVMLRRGAAYIRRNQINYESGATFEPIGDLNGAKVGLLDQSQRDRQPQSVAGMPTGASLDPRSGSGYVLTTEAHDVIGRLSTWDNILLFLTGRAPLINRYYDARMYGKAMDNERKAALDLVADKFVSVQRLKYAGAMPSDIENAQRAYKNSVTRYLMPDTGPPKGEGYGEKLLTGEMIAQKLSSHDVQIRVLEEMLRHEAGRKYGDDIIKRNLKQMLEELNRKGYVRTMSQYVLQHRPYVAEYFKQMGLYTPESQGQR